VQTGNGCLHAEARTRYIVAAALFQSRAVTNNPELSPSSVKLRPKLRLHVASLLRKVRTAWTIKEILSDTVLKRLKAEGRQRKQTILSRRAKSSNWRTVNIEVRRYRPYHDRWEEASVGCATYRHETSKMYPFGPRRAGITLFALIHELASLSRRGFRLTTRIADGSLARDWLTGCISRIECQVPQSSGIDQSDQYEKVEDEVGQTFWDATTRKGRRGVSLGIYKLVGGRVISFSAVKGKIGAKGWIIESSPD
jgi:hypothetical protein